MSVYNKENNYEIDLKIIFQLLLSNFKFIFVFTFLITALAAGASLLIPNIYTSSATLSMNDGEDSGLSSMIGSNSNLLGSLSGGLIPSIGGDNQNALSILSSRDFFRILYDSDEFLMYLMATKSYDSLSRKTFVDPKKYDLKNKKWIREVSHPFKKKPSLQEAHKIFLDNFSITEDDDKGVIILSFKHKSALFSNDVLKKIIVEINEYIRNKKINEAKKGIKYIEKKMSTENISEIRAVLASVMEADIQTLSLAEKTEEFIFKVIDSPFIPERKTSPKRTLICLSVAFSTFILSIFLVLLLFSDNRKIVFIKFIPRIKNI